MIAHTILRPALMLFLVLPAAPGARAQAQDLRTAPRIGLAEFKKLVDADAVVIIDVRDPASYEAGHVPGSRVVPLDRIQSEAARLKTAGKPIVTYCS